MTREEIIEGLKFTVDMFLLDPSTGETYPEPRNDMDKTTIDACKGAMELLEQEPCEMTTEEYRQRMIQAFHNADTDELIAVCVLPTEKEFEHLEWLLKNHYKKAPCVDAISREAVYSILNEHHIDEDRIKSDMDERQNLTVNSIASDVSLLPSVTQKSEKWIDGVHAMGYREGYKDAQKQKSGKWITDARTYYEELNKRGLGVDEYTPCFTDDIACSVCLAKYNTIDNETQFFKHCPNCGCRMVEPQESEDKE